MMKYRALATCAHFSTNDIIELDDIRAKNFLSAGLIEPFKNDVEKVIPATKRKTKTVKPSETK